MKHITSSPWVVFTLCLLSNSGIASDYRMPVVADPPVVVIRRDDHVATIEMDFEPSNAYQLWDVGDDGQDPVGYLVQWWPDAAAVPGLVAACGCATDQTTGDTIMGTESQPHKLVTANRVAQIQPIANSLWTNNANWNVGRYPPYYHNGVIRIQADCVVPEGVFLILVQGGECILEEGVKLRIRHDD
ncbi:MAG: hypothetical protein IPP15_23615 [Saprospiraceae bacterium]|uniref:Uncharacterized protein n=1 Tax=Candidatus Opimibacter skivensis TaxID=2982028 RepID=A0A9D7SXX6_9BACT|nr:hypothetical protein [Candidatus Opimibacter skivensis]